MNLEYKTSLEKRLRWRKYGKKWRSSIKERCLAKLCNGDIKCQRCGQTNRDLLEVNHKDGKGERERVSRGYNMYGFYAEIVNGKRNIDDLEVLCKVCNNAHYAELLTGQKYLILLKVDEFKR